ncbi:MAG TPA: glycosyltransferase [Longimicrobiales bacterium]|nr:glycosyltransferase [Longimicrobiales bacterium]
MTQTSGSSDPLRVLVLSRSYPSDVLPALGLWVERPTQLLSERCDIRVVSPSPWCPPVPSVGPLRQYARFRKVPRREVRSGVEIERPRFLAGPGRSLYPFEATAQELGMRKAIDRLRSSFPFDLIHAHMIYPEGVVAHRLSRRYGVPFVVSEHAPWSESWFASQRVRREALQAADAASALLAVSQSVRETMVSFGVNEDRAKVVSVGVDGEVFRLRPSTPRRRDQILYVGWIKPVKGVDVLLEAMALLKSRGEPGRLVLVGGAAYRTTRLREEELRRLALSLDLGDRVSFVGRRSHDEVARLMAESAAVVLPSRAESFGAVLVEALACGTPVVATRSGGPEDIVRDDVGILVPPDDPRALADAIVTVLRDFRRFPPEGLRDYALSRFSWDVIVKQVHAEYLRASGRSPAPKLDALSPLSRAS